MKDNNVECLFSALFFNNGIIITFIIKLNLTNVFIFPSEIMKRACSNNKSKQTQKRMCREQATICILHDGEDFITPLNVTKLYCIELINNKSFISDNTMSEACIVL